MALTPSTMLMGLGSPAPDFRLTDAVTGKAVTLATFADKKGLLVMFICRHCPYVQHVQKELAHLGEYYLDRGLGVVAVSANDAKRYPDDAPEKLKSMANELGFNFPFCHDESQEVAKAYCAACTPDFFLFDHDRKLVYRGQLDDSRPDSGRPVTGKDLRSAIDAVLLNRAVSRDQKPSIGCSIKWKPGNEPDYAR